MSFSNKEQGHAKEALLPRSRDIDALVYRFRDAAINRERVYATGQAARARAERWTWREAGASLVRALEG